MDEFTGRTLLGRRWGDGLHQAIEAKEGLNIQNETTTEASISYQVCRTHFSAIAHLYISDFTVMSDKKRAVMTVCLEGCLKCFAELLSLYRQQLMSARCSASPLQISAGHLLSFMLPKTAFPTSNITSSYLSRHLPRVSGINDVPQMKS